MRKLRNQVDLIRDIKKNNDQFYINISTSLSVLIDVAYMIFNGVMGIVHLSLWHGSICVYYFFLGLIRFIIVLAERKQFSDTPEKENFNRKVYIKTHLLLLIMDLAMITPILVMAKGGREFTYGLIIAIAYAVYATYKITKAIIHFAKTRKSDNILTSELRMIYLSDALLSILTLQNALIIANNGFSTSMSTLTMWSSCGIITLIFLITIISLLKVKNMK